MPFPFSKEASSRRIMLLLAGQTKRLRTDACSGVVQSAFVSLYHLVLLCQSKAACSGPSFSRVIPKCPQLTVVKLAVLLVTQPVLLSLLLILR